TQLNQLFLKLSNIGLRENSQLEQDVALFEFLFYLVQRHALEAPADISLPARKAIQQACDYLRAHCEQDVSLEELAAVVDLSRYHFCRLFRRETGVSVSTYQIQLRLARAKTLIMDGISLSEVAIATGFYDQSHFGKHFKRYVGTTPAKYTRHVQELS
ncbi:MAG: AraC family transcriptional regulator, partial [Cyanobacteria bacterium J06650_10]